MLHLLFKVRIMRSRCLLLLLFCLSLFACKEKQNSAAGEKTVQPPQPQTMTGTSPVPVEDSAAPYFSITDFFADQWNTRRGDPYTLLKVTVSGGQADSAFIPLDSTLWFSLCNRFTAADISDRKFLGWYQFDMFEDKTTESLHLHFEAAAAELYLRKMDVSADLFTHKIETIYLETRREENGRMVSQKMQYMPDRLFQFQTFEKAGDRPGRETKVQYWFQY